MKNHGEIIVTPDQMGELYLQLQRERIRLTQLMMDLRSVPPARLSRLVLRILIALLRLERLNRRVAAVLEHRRIERNRKKMISTRDEV